MAAPAPLQGTSRCIGLTGGIGSGKSTVARLFETHFAIGLVDADAVSRRLTAAGGAAVPAIAARFGPAFVTADGAMDRARMRALVFADRSARQALEQLLHPLIFEAIDARVHALRAQGMRDVLLDIPLLVESPHWPARLQHIIVVDCPPAVQLARVVQRSALPAQQVQAIIASQASRTQRLRFADSVVANDAIDLATLATHVTALGQLLRLPVRAAVAPGA
ncbi:hypothetical protein AAV94_01485 [Lampropedia cohaerens]|uniref:Dephospho-CoA kinase n=1 Tax=Lampropedia cohaerens TaxID=1610491 RepID=A0A0U1Q2X4_9BURK|nr:dephospho-CoA kinase [Lampropedia cohaerens]KKW69094.1 hypothetical protein AAV94_01485 [Lampropedia cohaerens]